MLNPGVSEDPGIRASGFWPEPTHGHSVHIAFLAGLEAWFERMREKTGEEGGKGDLTLPPTLQWDMPLSSSGVRLQFLIYTQISSGLFFLSLLGCQPHSLQRTQTHHLMFPGWTGTREARSTGSEHNIPTQLTLRAILTYQSLQPNFPRKPTESINPNDLQLNFF
ncbi:hypothetical protein AAMO2058_000152300 [Amorphochlora amoebiformis]